MALRVAFFGLPLAGVLLEADGHELVLAALSRTDTPGRRRLVRRLGYEAPRGVVDPKAGVLLRPRADDPALLRRLRELAPDLVVSWFWTTLLPPEVVGAARLGGIGVHPSLLPRHRGPDPTFWALAAGDRVTGVTVHRIAPDYDTGEILAQEALAIDPSWDAWQLAKALDRPSLRQLRAMVARFAAGERVSAVAQDESLATEAPRPTDDDCALRWSDTTERALRLVRAAGPSPGATTVVGDVVVTVLRAERAEGFPAGLQPGEGVLHEGVPVIRTADGALRILRAEVDGEPASAAELAALFA